MDTTVILAQPRVSRLRAAVVYVDESGWPGMTGQTGALLCRQSNGQFGPPKSIVSFQDFDAKNGPMARPDLVTFSASGVHPVYAYYFHPQHGEGYNPLWYDPQLGGTPPIHKRDYVAIIRQNVSRSHLRSPDIQGIPRG